MSWSISKTFATKQEAMDGIAADATLPQMIKDYLSEGIKNIRDEGLTGISVGGNGHLCDGPDSYETTSASLSMVPLR